MYSAEFPLYRFLLPSNWLWKKAHSELSHKPLVLERLTRSCAQALIVTLVYTPVLSSRAMAQSQVSTTLFEYDAQGNLTKRTDPRGVVTTQSYDGLHRLIQQIQPTVAAGVPMSPICFCNCVDLQPMFSPV